MNKPELTDNRVRIAFAVAIVADLIQVPLTLVEGTGLGFIAGEFADFLMDCVVFGITALLLGFHVALLPSAFLEVIPGLDVLPTWTGCVGFVVWQRRKEENEGYHQPLRRRPVADVETLKTVSDSSAKSLPPSSASTTASRAFRRSMDRLERLFLSDSITEQEFGARLQKLTNDFIDAD